MPVLKHFLNKKYLLKTNKKKYNIKKYHYYEGWRIVQVINELGNSTKMYKNLNNDKKTRKDEHFGK